MSRIDLYTLDLGDNTPPVVAYDTKTGKPLEDKPEKPTAAPRARKPRPANGATRAKVRAARGLGDA